jgi:hypothetical protein
MMELGNPEEAKKRKKKKANQTRANSDAHACMHAPDLSIVFSPSVVDFSAQTS